MTSNQPAGFINRHAAWEDVPETDKALDAYGRRVVRCVTMQGVRNGLWHGPDCTQCVTPKGNGPAEISTGRPALDAVALAAADAQTKEDFDAYRLARLFALEAGFTEAQVAEAYIYGWNRGLRLGWQDDTCRPLYGPTIEAHGW